MRPLDHMAFEKKEDEPGYSILRIRSLSPKPLVAIKEESPSRVVSGVMTRNEVKMELAHLSSVFIEELWNDFLQWRKDNPVGLGHYTSSGLFRSFTEIDKSKFIYKIEGLDANHVLENLVSHSRDIFVYLAKNLIRRKKEDLVDFDNLTAEQKINLRIFKRYQDVLRLGQSIVSGMDGNPVEEPDRHLLGGVFTSIEIITDFFGILENLFIRQYGHKPDKEELHKLLLSSKPIILAIAQTDVQTFDIIMDKLYRGRGSRSHMDDNFFLIERNGVFSLEVKKEILDEIEREIKNKENNLIHTGCPALYVKSKNKRNVISEIHDFYAKLFEEYYFAK